MTTKPRVFVSYTMRDGLVSVELLQCLQRYMKEFCEPFIHAVAAHRFKHQQLAVLRALFRSRLIIVLESPFVYHSRWVRLELFLGRLRSIRIFSLPVARVVQLSDTHFNGLDRHSVLRSEGPP